MNASTEEVAFGAGSDSRNNNSESRLSANFGGGFGEDISVPVYATIKGVSLKFFIKVGQSYERNLVLKKIIKVLNNNDLWKLFTANVVISVNVEPIYLLSLN
jgi:hypothetical protein